LKKAAEATAKITGGSLDVLINNAALVSEESSFKTLLD
jgi:NAD(P)-dependent dehydrogenase (short-subunit alcohol dehydrogenase family)